MKINEKNLSLFRKAFSFLIEDFSFREESLELDNWGIRLVFWVSTTGVRISYEPREGGIFGNVNTACRWQAAGLPNFYR